jgi:hypothetical protein
VRRGTDARRATANLCGRGDWGEAGSRTHVCVQPCKTSPNSFVLMSTTVRRAFTPVSNCIPVLLMISKSKSWRDKSGPSPQGQSELATFDYNVEPCDCDKGTQAQMFSTLRRLVCAALLISFIFSLELILFIACVHMLPRQAAS